MTDAALWSLSTLLENLLRIVRIRTATTYRIQLSS